jgi:DNA-binding response OmpR family regulator
LGSSGRFELLLVDPNRDEVDMYAIALALEGIPSRTAATAGEALSLIERTEPRALVTELRLPGTGGAELIRKVRSSHPSTFIVALTTSDGLDTLRAREAGCDVILHVPCLPETLVGELRRGPFGIQSGFTPTDSKGIR